MAHTWLILLAGGLVLLIACISAVAALAVQLPDDVAEGLSWPQSTHPSTPGVSEAATAARWLTSADYARLHPAMKGVRS